MDHLIKFHEQYFPNHESSFSLAAYKRKRFMNKVKITVGVVTLLVLCIILCIICLWRRYCKYHLDGLVQDCSNSIANTLQSCTKPSICVSFASGADIVFCIILYMNILGLSHRYYKYHLIGLVQHCSNSIASTVDLLQSCTKPSICVSFDSGADIVICIIFIDLWHRY